jgi:crotonobetainyl-CoA:carnitine CoA-transferase CaiB-like acyl-CoA transferase
MAGDGQWIQLGNLLQHLFDNFCTAAELFESYTEPRYEGSPATWAAEDREAFRDRMFERMREKTAAEWHQIFSDQGGVVSTTYQTTQQALDDPDLVLNGHVLELPDPASPSGMTMKTIGPVARLTQTPAAVRATAPSPGEHTASVLAESAASASGAATGRDASARPTLDGVLVLDFSTIIAGPLGCSHLADLGARVIKVEQIGGDPYRWMGPGGLGPIRTNQGKESISVDLKTEEGRAIVQALVAKADLLVHNYRPGVTERLGVGYGDASRLNPGIVYVNVNGYGPDGPSSHRPATHPIPGAALGGATWQAGGMPTGTSLDEIREGARRLFRANEVNPDPNTSAVVTTAALLGLVARRRHGIGQEIFVDMLGANAYANGDDFFWYEGRTPRGEIDAELLGTGPLYRLYRASEGWMFLGLLLDDEWRRFCSLTGRTDLASDARFATAVARDEHAAALTEVLEGLFTTQTAEEWESLLAPQGVGCVRADEGLPGAFWYTSDHIAANGMMETVTHGRHGALERHAPIIRTRGTPNRVASAPLAGEQTDAILDELGYTSEDIARLHTAGVVWHEDDLPGRQ